MKLVAMSDRSTKKDYIDVYTLAKHSEKEQRFILLGKTKTDRTLHITFTHRGEKIRIISARDQNKKERIAYESQKV